MENKAVLKKIVNMPFFSIIIPTYNRAHLIRQAISSVVNQSFTDWELLIVDDGSTDNTKEVVCQFFDDRIHYIYQENAERCAARNNGVALAKGAYICFLDSDDYFLPNRLSVLHKTINKIDYPKFVFFTGLKTLSSKGENDVPVVLKMEHESTTTLQIQLFIANKYVQKRAY
jgi:glycosyltransferase involved in cell wall biosynthesis